jgi:hypothetical protein
MTNSFDIVAAMLKPLETTRGISSQNTHLLRHSVQHECQRGYHQSALSHPLALCRRQHDANWRSKSQMPIPGLRDQYCRPNDKPAPGLFSAAIARHPSPGFVPGGAFEGLFPTPDLTAK